MLLRRSLTNASVLAFLGTVAVLLGVLENWWRSLKPHWLLLIMLTGAALLLAAIDLVRFFGIEWRHIGRFFKRRRK